MTTEITNVRVFLKILRDRTLEPYDLMPDGTSVSYSANAYLCMKIGRQKVPTARISKTWNPPINHLLSVPTGYPMDSSTPLPPTELGSTIWSILIYATTIEPFEPGRLFLLITQWANRASRRVSWHCLLFVKITINGSDGTRLRRVVHRLWVCSVIVTHTEPSLIPVWTTFP